MPISALPTPPSRSDSPQDFSDRADALLGALPGFVTEANALQSDVNAKEASASSHATIATNKAAEAQASATTASTKASEAAASAVAAAAAASNAEIAFDSFDDKYLGSKASDPTTDNDGNALLVGALYWNTSVGAVRVWNGAAWLSMAADASIVDFQQAGADAVVRTAQDKMREWVSVKDFGAIGNGVADDSDAIQKAINSIPTGGNVLFPRGNYYCASELTVSNNKIKLLGEAGSSLSYSVPTATLITITGTDCKIENLTINAPAVFDGGNVRPTYAAIKISGDRCLVTGCTLNNVPKIGIFIQNANDVQITNSFIDGGTSDTFFNGDNTVHFGVGVDTSPVGAQGNIVIANNIIKRCVQGVCSGNLDSASFEQAYTITGNVFELCWNHGFYSAGFANGHTITGNAFNACQVPVAATGSNHVVSSNTMIVKTSGTGLATDNEFQGISLRDPVGCIVIGNTIKGEAPNGSVVIGLDDLSAVAGNNTCSDNIVSNNIIEIVNTNIAGVAAIRLFSASNNVKNNIISGNIIKAPCRDNDGLISLTSDNQAASEGNEVSNNSVIINGGRGSGGYGILLGRINDTEITGNRITLESDFSSSYTIYAVLLSYCSRIDVRNNKIKCSELFGANAVFRGVLEANSGLSNALIDNLFAVNLTKLISHQMFVVLTTSGIRVDQVGTGNPEGVIIAAPGSIYRRTDGGANTTLYVKETGTSNVGWAAK